MPTPRVDLGFGGEGFASELDTLDQFAWASSKRKPAPASTQSLQAAEAAGFRSREPKPTQPSSEAPPVRRRRTGRNVQVNIKARAETIEAFTRIAGKQDWGFGETLEHAVALLEGTYGTKGPD